jgi:hypothetical protein
MKIKANDDRIQSTAVAVLLLCRERWARGEAGAGMISAALLDYRDDLDGFKERFPSRSMAEAKDLAVMVELITGARARERYQELIDAVGVVLARIERGKIQFSSLSELDNYFVANLRRFEV